MPPLYATGVDFTAYVEGWTTTDAAALDRLLERAERDVDGLFRNLPIIPSGTFAGRRFDKTKLLVYEREALARAVCAQAEYRWTIGEEELAGGQPTKVKGPDFEVEHAAGPDGARRRYSPKLRNELAGLDRFRQRGARAIV